ncbi:unnamed protein product [Amoebophrya sp. A25]|nr:unnamed protein product [Amoebophrya sp. A25]|eukprot:GSA25T00026106001.1
MWSGQNTNYNEYNGLNDIQRRGARYTSRKWLPPHHDEFYVVLKPGERGFITGPRNAMVAPLPPLKKFDDGTRPAPWSPRKKERFLIPPPTPLSARNNNAQNMPSTRKGRRGPQIMSLEGGDSFWHPPAASTVTGLKFTGKPRRSAVERLVAGCGTEGPDVQRFSAISSVLLHGVMIDRCGSLRSPNGLHIKCFLLKKWFTYAAHCMKVDRTSLPSKLEHVVEVT